MKRNHHRPLYQIWVCGALVFESRDANTAHEYARLTRVTHLDSKVAERTVYRDSGKLLRD